ncbi:MAG: hypothetical protein AB200_02335 [Parcubacteria bacterium C7867-005]|nr:MAG: hypothetical protein AB200_02335 [Parcubacteria bacterium C7867-005]
MLWLKHFRKIDKKTFAILGIALFLILLFVPTNTTDAACISISEGIELEDCMANASNAVLKILSFLLGLAGILLNYVIDYTVVDMKQHIGDLTSIKMIWETVRDIANMFFIFILLYASIKLILGDRSLAKETIKNLVIIALFINFSLFGTKVLIDASNIVTLTFYGAISPDAAQGDNFSMGLSNSFVAPLKIQTIYKTDGTDSINAGEITLVGIMGSIFILITTWVFLAITFFFLMRYVILILVMAFSPIAFLALVIPGLKDQAKQWKDALMSQLTFAPVFMFLAWVVIVIINDPSFIGVNGSETLRQGLTQSAAVNGAPSPGGMGLIINFFIAIALIVAALTTAKSISSKAGGVVGKMGSWAMGLAGGATVGLAGRAGRGIIGRYGASLEGNKELQDRAAEGSIRARLNLAAASKLSKSSFDIRATGIGKDLGAGKGQSGGYAKDLKDRIETEKKYADSLKPSELSVIEAKRKLDEAKKTDDPEIIADAQRKVDELSGANEDEIRKRKVSEIREESGWTLTEKQAKAEISRREGVQLREIKKLKDSGKNQKEAEAELEKLRKTNIDDLIRAGKSQKEAEKIAEETFGWKPKEIKGVGAIRKEAYAKFLTTRIGDPDSPLGYLIPDIKRIGLFGPTKKEYTLAAETIRKSIKDKKPAEKIAEEIAKQAKEAGDDTGTETKAGEPKTNEPTGGATDPGPKKYSAE